MKAGRHRSVGASMPVSFQENSSCLSFDLSANHRITQIVEVVSEFEKRDRMTKHLEQIMEDRTNKILIFTGTKRVADEITRFLRQDGWPALCKLNLCSTSFRLLIIDSYSRW